MDIRKTFYRKDEQRIAVELQVSPDPGQNYQDHRLYSVWVRMDEPNEPNTTLLIHTRSAVDAGFVYKETCRMFDRLGYDKLCETVNGGDA